MKGFFQRLWGPNGAKTRRNRSAVECLVQLGFPAAAIRRALLELNQVRIRTFVNGLPSSVVYQTVRGTRRNRRVMEMVADELGLQVEEVFPEVQSK